MPMGGRNRPGAATRRAILLAAFLATGMIVLQPAPAAADNWVKVDMGRGYDSVGNGGLYGVAIGDGDRDGEKEVYATCYDNGHVYEYRRGGHSWTVKDLGVLWPGRYPRADAIIVGDGDDDGRNEVYASGNMMTTGSSINSVYQLVNTSDGWVKTDLGQSGGWGRDIAMGDGNRDGRTELYCADSDGHIYQYSKMNAWNIQDIGCSPPFLYNNRWFNPYMTGVEVGDADNDGSLEVYGAATDNHVYQFTCTTQGWERTDLGAGEESSFPLYGLLGITIGDADNDGLGEIYAASYINATVWRLKHDIGTGAWNVSLVATLVAGATANDLCIGDGDSDGKNEIYVATSNKQLYEIRQAGGGWSFSSVGSGGGAICGVAVGSVTDDTDVVQLFVAAGDGHCYEYYQDRAAPANPVVWSDTHPVPGTWYNDRRVHMLWRDPGFDISGLDGYSTVWDHAPGTLPDMCVVLEESTHDLYTTLEDGSWYFHIRAGDNVHNWNASATHYGPVLIDTRSPDSVKLAIDDADGMTSGGRVSLSIVASDPSPGSGIADMAFSNDGTNWSDWEPFGAERAGWDLTEPLFGGNGSDGSKTVHAKVRDGVGREIPPDRRGRATIFLDRTAPGNLTLSINGGAAATNSTDVELGVLAKDPEPGSGMARMAFSNDGKTWGEWQDWRSAAPWSLTAGAGGSDGDGTKTVFFRAQDLAGNVGGPASASIVLDTGKPGGLRLIIDGGAAFTNAPAVSLAIFASDPEPGSPPLEMALSNSGNATGSWEPFSNNRPGWNLASGAGGTDTDGEKSVFLRVRDAAGNLAGPVSAKIFLDRLAPHSLGITVNGGADRTNRPEVELTLKSSDIAPSSGMEMMQFSEDGSTWSPWEPFAASRLYNLSGPDGQKTVHFRVRDRAGNVGGPATASIVLHASPPVISNLTVSGLTTGSATISWTTDEPSSGRVEFGTGAAPGRNVESAGQSRSHSVRLTGLAANTTYRFRVSSTDELANNATSAELNFTTLESYTPPPPGKRPHPAPEKGFPWIWAAVPALALGAAAVLFVAARKRRGRAPDERAAEEAGDAPAGPPEAMRAQASGPGPAGAAPAAAVDWGQPEAAGAPPPAEAGSIETLAMDDGIPIAPAVAVAPPAPAARPPPAAPARPAERPPEPLPGKPPARTVRCSGCGASVPVLSTAFPVRIMCPGCGRNGVYRGPRRG